MADRSGLLAGSGPAVTSLVRRPDGRVLVRVPLPRDIVDRADRLSKALAQDRADFLGDVVAHQMREALVEAARLVLPPDATTPAAVTAGVPTRNPDNPRSLPIISAGGLDELSPPDGDAP